MAILGKIGQALGQIGRYYTSPEGLQTAQAMLMDYANPGAGAYMALQSRREKMLQERKDEEKRQQMLSSFNDLVGRIRPPDTYTPQVNQLIGAANETGARFGMAPMQRNTPQPSGLDLQDPTTRQALMSFVGAGGNIDTPFALAERMAPPAPNMSLFNTRSGVVGINPQTGEAQELYSDPYAEALAQRQIEAQGALAEQRRAAGQANMIRANRQPAPRARAAAAPAAGPSIDQPWTLFKQ